jgi:hypothetical protein
MAQYPADRGRAGFRESDLVGNSVNKEGPGLSGVPALLFGMLDIA